MTYVHWTYTFWHVQGNWGRWQKSIYFNQMHENSVDSDYCGCHLFGAYEIILLTHSYRKRKLSKIDNSLPLPHGCLPEQQQQTQQEQPWCWWHRFRKQNRYIDFHLDNLCIELLCWSMAVLCQWWSNHFPNDTRMETVNQWQ